jgi:DNA repair protein RecO (recombination protein O)
MPVQECEAIVLRQYSLSDSDRIIVFITREHGKIRAVGRGVKKPRNHLAGCLEPLNHLRLEFSLREGRDLGQVHKAELIHSYLAKNPTLRQISAFSYFAELINELVQDNQPNEALFRLFLSSLNAGERHSANVFLIRYFEIWCLRLSGLFPHYAYCSGCGKYVKDHGFFAWLEAGEARCDACAQGKGIRVGAPACAALDLMARLSPEEFMQRPHEYAAAEDLERLSRRLLDLHLEKQLKSYRILREALQKQ